MLTSNSIRRKSGLSLKNGVPRPVLSTSASSGSRQLYLWVEASELDPGVFHPELPLDATLTSTAVARSRSHLADQSRDTRGTSPQVLPRQDAQFTLGSIKPTAVLGGIVDFQPLGQAASLFRRKSFVQRSARMHVAPLLIPTPSKTLALRSAQAIGPEKQPFSHGRSASSCSTQAFILIFRTPCGSSAQTDRP
jgi:hypothetical protein